MKKILFTILFVSAVASASAQYKADKADTAPTEFAEAPDDVQMYKPVAADGVLIQVPDQCLVQRNESVVTAKYPDGSFGVSVEVDDKKASQKECYQICLTTAKNDKLKDISVKKVTINGLKGAVAYGILENRQVSIIVLSGKRGRYSVVMMNSPERSEWARHAVRSIQEISR